jgi:hypothetical protein
LLLLLANATLFAIRLDSGGTGDAVRLTQQVRPEMIKMLTPQQVAVLGPQKWRLRPTFASNGVLSTMPKGLGLRAKSNR